MSATVEAAWIAASSGFLGVVVGIGGTVAVAISGFRSTRNATAAAIAAASADIKAQIEAGSADIRAQIEADRRNRVWEKQAAAYTDAIAYFTHVGEARQRQMASMITGTEPRKPSPPVDWRELQARLTAYSSAGVLDALIAAADAGAQFAVQVDIWREVREQPPALPGEIVADTPTAARKRAENAGAEASKLEATLMAIIRDELHATTARAPAPTE